MKKKKGCGKSIRIRNLIKAEVTGHVLVPSFIFSLYFSCLFQLPLHLQVMDPLSREGRMKRLGVNYTGFLADKKKGAKESKLQTTFEKMVAGVKEKSWTRK